jgi:hypothetical protein
MRAQFPAGQVRLLASSNGVKLHRRKLNQVGIYFLTYDNVTIHVGTRKYVMRKFNYYTGNTGKTLQQVMQQSQVAAS